MKKQVIITSISILIIFLIINIQASEMIEKNKIIAHKKHTIQEINKSIKSNISAIEIDIRKTKDNIFVAFHNSTFNNKKISEQTYNQLNNMTKLKTILTNYPNLKLNIHLKEPGYEIELMKLLLNKTKEQNLIITSEHFSSLKKIREISPDIKLGLIILKTKNPIKFSLTWIKLNFNPTQLIKQLKKEKINFIVPNQEFINKNLIQTAEKHNIKIIPWTINNKEKIEQLQDKFYAVISDKTEF